MSGNRSYDYDPLNNIEAFTNDGVTTHYSYEGGTNRLCAVSGALARTNSYNARGK